MKELKYKVEPPLEDLVRQNPTTAHQRSSKQHESSNKSKQNNRALHDYTKCIAEIASRSQSRRHNRIILLRKTRQQIYCYSSRRNRTENHKTRRDREREQQQCTGSTPAQRSKSIKEAHSQRTTARTATKLNDRTFTCNPLGEIIPPIRRLGLNWQGSERSVRVNLALVALCFPPPLLLHPSLDGPHWKSSGKEKERYPSQVEEDPRTKNDRIRRGGREKRDLATKQPNLTAMGRRGREGCCCSNEGMMELKRASVLCHVLNSKHAMIKLRNVQHGSIKEWFCTKRRRREVSSDVGCVLLLRMTNFCIAGKGKARGRDRQCRENRRRKRRRFSDTARFLSYNVNELVIPACSHRVNYIFVFDQKKNYIFVKKIIWKLGT